jgi:hypothetical protein
VACLQPHLLDHWVLRLMTRNAGKMTKKHVLFFTKRVLGVGFWWFRNKTAVEWRLIIGVRSKKSVM